jgi:glycosyltransferase involved in cell wall biosynthesis
MRYVWDLREQYLKESNLDRGLKGVLARWILDKIQIWDKNNSKNVDYFIAISEYIKDRILRAYDRTSDVIYPPVDVDQFQFSEQKEDFYLTASRMVPYKRMPMIVETFSKMQDKKLVVIGDGPEFEKCKAFVTDNIEILGYQEFDVLHDYMRRAKAFVFAAEEDFGITPLEAQACGTPVIAYGKGGALETIRGLELEEPTGLFFHEQSINALLVAISDFEKNEFKYLAKNCRKNAERFSAEKFRDEFKKYMDKKINNKCKSYNDNCI